MIIVSTPDGDVELTGEEKEAFLADLPGEVAFDPIAPTLTVDTISSGLEALGFTKEQIAAFISAVSK